MAEYRLSALLTVRDRMTAQLRSAAKAAGELTRGVGGVKDTRIRLNVDGLEKLRRLKEQARAMKFSPLRVNLQDSATPKLTQINQTLRSLSSKSHNILVNAQVRGGEQVNALKTNINRLKTNVNEFGSGMLLAGGVGVMGAAGLGYGVADTVDTYKKFEYQMVRNKALFTSGMERDESAAIYQKLMETARHYGSTMIYTNAEVGKALEYMALAGWDAQTSMKGLPAVLNAAVASGEDLALVSDIITDDMTAMGYKAGTYVKNGMGEMVEATQHFSDVLLRTTLRSNTNFQQLGFAMKYAAPLAHSLGYSIEDVAIAMGLMANNGIKADQAGTGLRGIMLRMIKEPKQTAAAMESLGLSMFNADGSARGFMATLMDVRAKLRGKDAENILSFVEQMTGEEIGQRGEVAEFLRQEMAQNGGKLTDQSFAKLASSFSGTYALAPFLALMNSSDEEIQKLITEIYQKADGTGAEINREMMNTLQGDLKTLQSAWEDFQFELLNGHNAAGLRSFLQAVTADVNAFKTSLKDGFDIGDIFGLVSNAVTQLKNKFLELDGIGSILAGGVLMVGLKKLLDMGLRLRTALGQIGKVGATAALSAPAATATSAMNIRAGVVNLSGPIKGALPTNATSATRPTPLATTQNSTQRSQIIQTAAGKTNITDTTTARNERITNIKSAAVSGAAFAAIFAAMDFFSAKSLGDSRVAEIDAQIAQQKQTVQELRAAGAEQEQISHSIAAIKTLENERNSLIKQTANEQQTALAGGVGSVLGTAAGAALGSLIGPIGTMLGGIIGGLAGDKIGRALNDLNAGEPSGWQRKRAEERGITPPVDYFTREKNPPSVADFRKLDVQLTPEKSVNDSPSVANFRHLEQEQAEILAAARAQTQRFQLYDEELAKRGRTPLFNNTAESTTQDYYRQKAADIKPTPIELKLPDLSANEHKTNINPPAESIPKMYTPPMFDFSFMTPQNDIRLAQDTIPKTYSAPMLPEINLPEPSTFNLTDFFDGLFFSKAAAAPLQMASQGDSPDIGLENIRTQADGIGEIFTSLGTTVSENLTTAFEGVGDLFNTFGTSVTEGLTASFDGIGEIFASLGTTVNDAFMFISEGVNVQFMSVSENLTAGLTGMQSAAETSLAAIKATFDSGIQAIQSAWSTLPGFFEGVMAGLGGAASAAGAAIAAGLTAPIGSVIAAWQAAAATISAIISGISAGSSVAPIASNYSGTASFEGGFTEINEHGGELAILPSGTKIYPHATTERLLQREISQRLPDYSAGLDAINFPMPFAPNIQPNFTYPTEETLPVQHFLPANETNTESNINTTETNINLGGVTINNSADFDEFLHRLQKLFAGSVQNSWQY